MKTQSSKKTNFNRDALLAMGIMVAIIITIGIWFDLFSRNTYMNSISRINSIVMHQQIMLPH